MKFTIDTKLTPAHLEWLRERHSGGGDDQQVMSMVGVWQDDIARTLRFLVHSYGSVAALLDASGY